MAKFTALMSGNLCCDAPDEPYNFLVEFEAGSKPEAVIVTRKGREVASVKAYDDGGLAMSIYVRDAAPGVYISNRIFSGEIEKA